jgi:hypothetical protein
MMGEKAKSFTGEDSNAVVDLASAMLGASSNMFDAAYSNVAKAVENKTDISLLVIFCNTLTFFWVRTTIKIVGSVKEPVVDVEPVPIPAKYAAPESFYKNNDESGDFPEDRYEEFLIAETTKAQNEDENRKKVNQL